jgi:hypothetical protein
MVFLRPMARALPSPFGHTGDLEGLMSERQVHYEGTA